MTPGGRVGVYPGSFNPPTIAHLALSEAALSQRRLDRIVWSVSRVALAKEGVVHPRFDRRLEILEQVAADVEWLEIRVTDAQLMVDVARGFDVVIMGADKWAQINELRWYRDREERDAAIAALPEIAVAPRPPHPMPDGLMLAVEQHHADVSSSIAREGAVELMLHAARDFSDRTGAWIDRERYDRWEADAPGR